ncbi:MAG TPA: ATP-binding protein [Kofleriaceae bacterium]|nr:ATP-binding protein [Kofleriaceae bacterium]
MSARSSDSEPLKLRVVMGSIERAGAWTVPPEVRAHVFWGNLELDLRDADIGDVTTIDAHVTMGNLQIVVPREMIVDVAVNSFAGNVENRQPSSPRQVPPTLDGSGERTFPGHAYRDPVRAPAKRLRVTGSVKFANCEIIPLDPGETLHDHARRVREDLRRRRHYLLGPHDPHHRVVVPGPGGPGPGGPGMHGPEQMPGGFGHGVPSHGPFSHRGHHRHHHRRRGRNREERLAALEAEREIWRAHPDRSAWLPWWLQARMRRRIFSWFAIAFVLGTLAGIYLWPDHRWWHFVLAALGLSVMSGAVSWRLTRPLILVVQAARDIGDGKLDTRLDIHQRGEMKILAMAINDMASRIEQQLKDQKQLLAAVSHELRTPLGHMRVLIETARDTHDAKALSELDKEVLTLDDLVGRLLASSRLEFGNLDKRTIDLGELASDLATQAGVAPEGIEAEGDVKAAVDPTLVRRAIANLLDNAKTHGGGAVAVRVVRRGPQVVVEVDDAGPGVGKDRRADAFRAFVPSSGGGLGLGLALVSRIAVAHEGGAYIHDRPGGGARVGFTVTA